MRSQFKLVLVGAAAAASLSSPAAARQAADCSAGDLRPIADGWLPVSVGLTLAEKKCEAREFMKRVLSTEEDPDKITPSDVLVASRPPVDPEIQRARDEYAAAQRIKFREEEAERAYLRRNVYDEGVEEANRKEAENLAAGRPGNWGEGSINDNYGYAVLPPEKPGGQPKLVEPDEPGGEATEKFTGDGVILGPDGIQSGTFENGRLDGPGEEIEEDGTWRAGEYDGGQMDGPGMEIGEGKDGKPYLLTGNFEHDQPDGQVTVTYTGGASRHQYWVQGQMASEGPLAVKGTLPKEATPNEPNGNWHVDSFQRIAGNYQSPRLEVVKLDGVTYLVRPGADANRRDGMMLRVYGDGMVQYEEWRNGRLVQQGARGPYESTIPPQPLPEEPTYAAAPPAPAPAPTSYSSSSGGGYPSVCSRNYSKLQSFIYSMGGIDWGIRVHSEYMRMWAQCRGSGDPQVEQQYQENADFLQGYQSRAHVDNITQQTSAFLNELSRAISDPNYSAELGSVRGQAAPAAPAPSTADPRARPGTSVGDFNVASPVLGSDFYSKYSAKSLPPDQISQQENSSAELSRIQSQINATGDVITRLRLLIAQLEGMIVIHRQSQDIPGERQRIQEMINSRNAAIENCKAIASDQGSCTAPLR